MEQQAVYVFAQWWVQENKLEQVMQLLAEAIKQTRQEPGNLFFTVHQSNADPDTIMLYEGYINQAAVDEHKNSTHYQTLVAGQIIPLLENREVIVTSLLDI